MQHSYDYKKFAVLYVDDEEKSLKYFKRAFEDQFQIFTASNAEEGFKILQEKRGQIAVLITDQRMPGEKGVQLLEKVRHAHPKVIRMLATAYSDIEAAISAVNTGAIYKYIHKPWDVPDLEVTLKRALEFYMVQLERDHLLQEKISVLQNVIIRDRIISLGVLAAGLNHRVRNSLDAIRSFLNLAPARLREENLSIEALRNPNYWQDFYAHVQEQVNSIAGVIGEIGGGCGNTEPAFTDQVQVAEAVGAAIAAAKGLLEGRGINVENGVPSSLPRLTVDAPKFQRIFELLLKDQSLGLPAGGCVQISAEAKDSGIKVTVRDNGSELPVKHLQSLFNPFALPKDKSPEFGLNLLACYFLVYHHGGSIQVETAEGKGTVFELSFPVNPQESGRQGDRDFVSRVVTNDELWERLMSME